MKFRMETKAKCLWRLVKAIVPRSTFLMTATCVGNWSVEVRHVCWSHAPTSRTSQKLAGRRTWSLGVSQCQGQHQDQPEPEQAISPHLQTVAAANFSIHYRDSQEQDLKMTSSGRGKFKFSRMWCHNTIQSVGFLNIDIDTRMNTQYSSTLHCGTVVSKTFNDRPFGLHRDPKNLPPVKIFVDKHLNFIWWKVLNTCLNITIFDIQFRRLAPH